MLGNESLYGQVVPHPTRNGTRTGQDIPWEITAYPIGLNRAPTPWLPCHFSLST